MRSLAFRRYERVRAIVKARAAYPGLPDKLQRRLAKNRKPCSCWACGNPRRRRKGADRKTMQERRAAAWDELV